MTIIGIDSRKDTLAGCLIGETQTALEHERIPSTSQGCEDLVEWVQAAGVALVAVEGSGNYGYPAAVELLTAGVAVVEVPLPG